MGLVLKRKQGESIRIGEDIVIIVTEIAKNSVKLRINAPRDLPVHRSEIYDAMNAKSEEGSCRSE